MIYKFFHCFILISVLLFNKPLAFSDTCFFYVQLTDKNNSSYSLETPLEYLSERSIQRRLDQNIAVDSTDLPISPNYLSQIKDIGVEIHSVSKWMNGVTVLVEDSNLMNEVRKLNCVNFAEYTGKMSKNPLQAPYRAKFNDDNDGEFLYGSAFNQINQLQGQALHKAGYTGKNIWIALLDAGYAKVNQNSAFDSLRLQNRLIGTKNIVDSSLDVFDEHYHGSNVLSTMAANIPNQYLGSAPHASYLLIQTEYNPAEYPFEIDFWVAGLEYADSVGVDVVNSSLGYSEFDDVSLNFSINDMDGMTVRSSRAAYLASRKGIIVCSSAGNEGSTAWKKITSPADAQGIVTVGAVNSEELLAPFSSLGPTADNRIKPDVCATGWSTALVNQTGDLIYSNGTSYSSPIVAGLLACYLQYCKENLPFAYSVDMILENLLTSSNRFTNPNNQYGYGIPNFQKVLLHSKLDNLTSKFKDNFDEIYFDYSARSLIVNRLEKDDALFLSLIDSMGKLINTYIVSSGNKSIDLEFLPTGIYLIHANRKNTAQTVKILIP